MTGSKTHEVGGSGVLAAGPTLLPRHQALRVPGLGALESAWALDKSQRRDPSQQLARGLTARPLGAPRQLALSVSREAETRSG